MFLVKSRKSLLRLQILIQRQRMLPVDIDLPVVRECDSKVGIAECNDLLVGSRCLMFKLVARKIQNLKSHMCPPRIFCMLLLLHTSFYPCFQFRLRHESDILADHLAVL